MTRLTEILTRFRDSGWDLIAAPAADWLNGKGDYNALLAAVKQADEECGSCGCDFDPLYKEMLELLDLAKKLPPCTLLCHTCFGLHGGAISTHAKILEQLYEGWYEGHVNGYGPNPTPQQQERLKSIENFNKTLQELQKTGCEGCRINHASHGGCIPGCKICVCTEQHGVLWCADCPDFPCNPEGIVPENVMGRWNQGNHEIRETSALEFFRKNAFTGHYAWCKEQ